MGSSVVKLGRFVLAIAIIAAADFSVAQSVPQFLNLSGGLFNPNGTPVLQASVNFKVEVWDANNTCVLYSEEYLGQDLSSSKGAFALGLGKGSSINNAISGTTSLNRTVFQNAGVVAPFSGCASGVTLASGDRRLIRVFYDLGAGYVAMTPDVPLDSSAYAMIADTLQGKTPEEFLQVRDDASYDLSQANLENIFSATNYTKLDALVAGTSSMYMVTSPAAAVSFNSQRITNLADPTGAQDAATKNYSDSYVGGKSAITTGVGPATGDGATLIWDQAGNRWTTGTPAGIDNTKLPLAGGTMSGAINMGSNDITATGHITQSAQRTITIGAFTNAQDTTLVGTLGAPNAGATWYNSDTGTLRLWNGTAATSVILDGGNALGSGVSIGTRDSNDLKFKTNNSVAMTVAADGKVGIGSTTPGSELDVKGTLRLSGATSGYVGFAPPAVAGNTTYTLPNGDGTGGFVLSTDGSGALSWIANTAGSVTSVSTGTGLTGGPITTTGTIHVDVGTTANKIVQLTSGAQYPAVDGNLITNVNAAHLQARPVAATAPTSGQVLTWNSTTSQWQPEANSAASAITALTGDVTATGPGSVTATIANDAVTSAKINSTGIAVNRLLVTDATTGASVTYATCSTNGEFLHWTASGWACTTPTGGTVVNIATGNGLSGGPISVSGTIIVDTGVTANKIVQLTSGAQYPAVDGNLITNVNAVQLQARNVVATAPVNGQVLTWNNAESRWEPGYSSASYDSFVLDGNSWAGVATLGTNDAYDLMFETAGVVGMTLKNGGNVGIGTTAPGAALDVVGTSSTGIKYVKSGSKDARISVGDPTKTWSIASGWSGAGDFSIIEEGVAGDRLYIKQGGNVGIGTTSPTNPLDVVGSGAIRSTNTGGTPLYLVNSDTGGKTWSWISSGTTSSGGAGNLIAYNSSDAQVGMLITPSGNVGIGTTAPSQKLDVSGNVRATSFISTSDARLKTNIRTVAGIETVRKLHGVSFDWIETGKPELGTIAQEVEQVLPDLVVTDPSTGFKAVKYQGLIAPLIEATKDLDNMCKMNQTQIMHIDSRVKALEARAGIVARRIQSLESENRELREMLKAMDERLKALESVGGSK